MPSYPLAQPLCIDWCRRRLATIHAAASVAKHGRCKTLVAGATPIDRQICFAVAVAKPISKATNMGGTRSNKGQSLRCKCGNFMSNHIIVKLRQEGVCSCPDGVASCAAKWVRDGYVCPKDKKNEDGAEAMRVAVETSAKQQAHREARERWRLKNRVKRPKTKRSE